MRDRSAREAAAVVAAYDFTALDTLVDVGGGGGVLLTAILNAAPDSVRLLVVEAELPERAADHPAAIRKDLHMLALLGGRERTRAEHAALLVAADLRWVAVVPADPVSGVHVFEARPA